jgi:site-specific recombinase XerD
MTRAIVTGNLMHELQLTQPSELLLVEPLPLDRHPVAVFLGSLTSAHSKRNMHRYLDQMAALLTGDRNAFLCNWGAVRYPHTQAIRARLAESYAPATVNGMLSALRGVLKEAWNLGYMSAEDYQRAVQVKNIKGETLPAGRDLAQGEVLALVNACTADESAAGLRDAALIGVLYTGGLRRAEAAALDLDDFDDGIGKLTVRSGKGRKARTVYLSGGALDALLDWLTVRGTEAGALFMPVNKGGNIQHRRMSAQAIYNILEKRGLEAHVKDFSPHDFRRTFVGDLLDRGVDIVIVQKLVGHASVTTTGRYDRRPEATKRQAATRLHFPYQRRKRDAE